MQAKRPATRQKRCKACQDLFQSDARTKGKQGYCSKEGCQKKRQRLNEKNWRKRNPESVEYQYEQTRRWNKVHPEYSQERRANNIQLLEQNRDRTRKRMRKIRSKKEFDKSKVILMQLLGNKADKCYLAYGSRWLHVRLTKARSWTRVRTLRDNDIQCERVSNQLPKGRLYDLSGMVRVAK